jgi:ABC-type amino acid transport substrate-binding protein
VLNRFTRALGALLFAACAASSAQRAIAQDAQALKVCMAEGNPPLSYRVGSETRGLDVLLARAIAAELGRPLAAVPFESKFDKDTSLTYEVNALLSSGVCELASGFPLLAPDLGAPMRARAKAPDYPGAAPRRQRAAVALGTLIPSRAYHASVMGVVLREPGHRVGKLADLKPLRVGTIAGTMASAALMLYRNGMLRNNVVSLAQHDDLLASLDAGQFDAVLVPLNKFDAYRLAHPQTRLVASGFVHPLQVNLGLVALEGAPQLIAAANRVIERARANGELESWARETGVTWARPAPPDVSAPFSFGSLLID